MNTAIEYGGILFSANLLILALFKYAFAENYVYPFLGLAIFAAPLALYGLFMVIRALISYNGRNKLFYLTGANYFYIGLLYAGSMMCSIYSLTYSNTDLTRFLVLSYSTEAIFLPAISHFILDRQMFIQYSFSSLAAVAATLIHELCAVYRNPNKTGVTSAISPNSVLYLQQEYQQGYQGPILAVAGKLLWILACVLSKKMLVSRAFFYKLKSAEAFKQPSFMQMHPREDQQRKKKFYQQYFEGEDQPKLLKKDSVINRRFELFKRVERMLQEIAQIEEQNVVNAQYKGLSDQRLALVKRLATQNCIRTADLMKVPSFTQQQKPFLQFETDYGFLHAEELDEIMDLDETYINTQIKKGNVQHFSELKKWELQAVLEMEQAEKNLLEDFLNDYHDVKLNAHLFSDLDDLLLTKLDEMFDSLTYDCELFNFDVARNLEIYCFASLVLMLASFFGAFFNNEIYLQLYIYNDNRNLILPKMSDNNLWILFLISAIISVIKPLTLARIVRSQNKAAFFALRLLTDFILLFTASTLTEKQPTLMTTQLLALTLNVLSHYLIYVGAQNTHEWAEFSSLLDMAKTHFTDLLEPEQIIMMEIRLIQIHYVLGKDAFQRIMLDLFASHNPRLLLHTANPVLFLRQQFDPFYMQRTKNWGGSYPRPLVEAIESSWISTDQKDIWISSKNVFRKHAKRAAGQTSSATQSQQGFYKATKTSQVTPVGVITPQSEKGVVSKAPPYFRSESVEVTANKDK